MLEQRIIYRGSIHDLATDVAYELTTADAAKLIAELITIHRYHAR